jgi:hypothetical protein
MESKVRKGKVITKAVACEGGSIEVFNEKGKRIATLDVPES